MAFEITVPRLGWSMEEGTFLGWLKEEGEHVSAGDSLFSLESEKASQEVEALDSGILRIAPDAPPAGSTILVGALLGYLVAHGETFSFSKPPEAAAEPAAIGPEDAAPPAALPIVTAVFDGAGVAKTAVSPRAARTARALGIDLGSVQATGRSGRIRERDVLAAASGPERREPPLVPEKSQSDLPGRTAPAGSMRRAIARRLSAGLQRAVPVTLMARMDATELVLTRQRLKSAAAPGEPIPSFNDMLVKFAAAALQDHPFLNAQWREETIFFPAQINVAIAVDIEGGLLAPVIRDVPALSLAEVAAASRHLIAAARADSLTGEQLQGGTFTITNLGGLGIESFTPIINVPQCAILGVGRIAPEPVVVEGRIEQRQMVALSLSFDHRIVDGAPAGRFLQALRGLIEDSRGIFDD